MLFVFGVLESVICECQVCLVKRKPLPGGLAVSRLVGSWGLEPGSSGIGSQAPYPANYMPSPWAWLLREPFQGSQGELLVSDHLPLRHLLGHVRKGNSLARTEFHKHLGSPRGEMHRVFSGFWSHRVASGYLTMFIGSSASLLWRMPLVSSLSPASISENHLLHMLEIRVWHPFSKGRTMLWRQFHQCSHRERRSYFKYVFASENTFSCSDMSPFPIVTLPAVLHLTRHRFSNIPSWK